MQQNINKSQASLSRICENSWHFSQNRHPCNNATLVQNALAPTSVVIVADSNLQQYLTATVSGGVLDLGVESGTSISPSAAIEVTVSAPLFSRAESTGTGNLTGQGLDASPNLSIQNTGTGNIP
jgi:hypothetical protein